MKKYIWLMVLALLFTSCDQPAQPVSGESAPESSTPSVSQAASQADQSSSSPGQTMAQQAPLPDGLPQAQPSALELPSQLAQAQEGYGLELLTPAQYEAVLDNGKGGPRGFLTGDVFILGLGEDQYALANPNGKIVTGFDYEGSQDGYWWAYGGWIAMVKDRKVGLVDALDGTELLPFVYDSISNVFLGEDTWSDQLVEARKKDEIQIIEPRTGKVVFSLERGDAFYAMHDRYVVLQGEMLRIYDLDYQPVSNFVCSEVKVYRGDPDDFGDLLGVNCNGLWGLTDQDGNFLVDPIYEDMGYFKGDYVEVTKNGKKGVLNYQGKLVVAPEWDDLILYDTSASVCKDGRWGAITDLDSGEVGVPVLYDFVYEFGKNGYACFERKGKYGLVDREGNEMLSASYDGYLDTNANLEEGYFLVDGNSGPGTAGIIGPGGKVLISSDHLILQGGEGEPYNLVATPRGKWGYVDRTGQYVIDAKYDNAGSFLPGKEVAFVELDGKIQLIDRQGNPVLSTVFSDVIGFNPETMVCAMEYTDPEGARSVCLARVILPEGGTAS